MARPNRLREVEAITFDCYGTLIDWEGGAKQTLEELLAKKAAPQTGPFRTEQLDEFFQQWERAQWQRIHADYQPYHTIAAESLLEVARAQGLPLTVADARAFADAIPRWQPFPDTVPALAALERHVRLGIISNIDDRLLAGSVEQMGVKFDLLVTAEQARAYKPSEQPFELALERLGLPAARVAHAAFGFEYDLVTAARLGFRTILVRRRRTEFPAEPIPDLRVANLAELAAAFG
jgi:2-haloalkanoic acid dehalogenase type II